MTSETDTAHDVYLKQPVPSVVAFVEESHGLVYAEIVDEDVDVCETGDGLGTSFRGSVVRHKWEQVGARKVQRLQGLRDAGLRSSIDDHFRSFGGQRTGDLQADAARGGSHQRCFVVEG